MNALAFIVAASMGGVLATTQEAADDSRVLFLDARPQVDYKAGHVAGAHHLDVDALSETQDGVPNVLKPLPEVTQQLKAAAVDPAQRIVVYSAMESVGDVATAARMFWILEYLGYEDVAVLDGGYAKWTSEDRPIETGLPAIEPLADLELEPDESKRATFEETRAASAGESGASLFDFRGASDYLGETQSSRVARAGCIPGAANVPMETLVDGPHFEFKPAESLRPLFGSGDDGEERITYCNSGRSASVGYFASRLAGFKNVAMYDGSMADWSRRPGAEMDNERSDEE